MKSDILFDVHKGLQKILTSAKEFNAKNKMMVIWAIKFMVEQRKNEIGFFRNDNNY